MTRPEEVTSLCALKEMFSKCKDLVEVNGRNGICKMFRQLGIARVSVHTKLIRTVEMKNAAKLVPHNRTHFDRHKILDFAHTSLAQ